jgi:hypothetical protein
VEPVLHRAILKAGLGRMSKKQEQEQEQEQQQNQDLLRREKSKPSNGPRVSVHVYLDNADTVIEGGPPFSAFCSLRPITKRGCPILAFFATVGGDAAGSTILVMPRGLHRYYGADHLHFITCSCYRREPVFCAPHGAATASSRCSNKLTAGLPKTHVASYSRGEVVVSDTKNRSM